MKTKLIKTLSILSVLCLLFTACDKGGSSGKDDTKTTSNAVDVQNKTTEEIASEVLKSNGYETSDFKSYDAEDLTDFYNIPADSYDEFSAYYKGQNEVVVIKAKSDKADVIKTALETYFNETKQSANAYPDMMKYFDKAEVAVDGDIVKLVKILPAE